MTCIYPRCKRRAKSALATFFPSVIADRLSTMYSCSKFLFSYCKLLGIAPVKLFNQNYIFCKKTFVRNICFLVVLVTVGFHALFSDYKNTFHGTSARMKTRTAIVVTFLEIFLSLVVITSGIIGAAFNYDKLNRIEQILKNMDSVLRVEPRFNKFMLVLRCILVHHIILISVDVRFWFNLTPYSWSYTICYVYLFVEIAIEAQFAFVVLNISVRFETINERLAETLQVNPYSNNCFKNSWHLRSANHFSFELFQELHWSLCDAMSIVNSAFGWQLLTSILCIFVHIIVTPYFLLLDLFYPAAYGSADIGFLVLQVVWIITHHIQLFLLVLPASETSQNAKQSVVIICEHLQNRIPLARIHQMEAFIIQLKTYPMKFSACGLFHLQRPVITSLIGSVVTYLVILIQFQNSDKVFH